MEPSDCNQAYTENKIMQKLSDNAIIAHKGYFEDESQICIVQELMSTDLCEVFYNRSSVRRMRESFVRKLFYQMLKSVAICHQNNIIHRDIKLENFLADIDADNQLIIKLTDFGLACEYSENAPPSRRCGTLPGIAPEIIDH